MSIQKISKYAQHFDLVVLYEADTAPSFREYADAVFRTSDYRPIEAIDNDTSLQAHLFILCGSANFLKLPLVKSTLASSQYLELLILTPDYMTIPALKTALYLRASNVNNIPMSEDDFVNVMMGVFSTLVKKHNESILSNYDRTISEYSNNLFWIHKEGKAVYANNTLKRNFGIKRLADLDQYFNDSDIASLLKIPEISQKVISQKDLSGEKKDFFVTNQPLKDGEYLVSMIPLSAPIQDSKKQLHNRMSFIELLKEAFQAHKKEDESIPVIVMYIENSEKIIEMKGENIYNDVCKEILILVQSYFDIDIQIALWHKDIYTLIASNNSLNELKEKLEKFHESLNTEISIEGTSPMIGSFLIDMQGIDLNKAIGIIDHINQKQLISRDLTHLFHFEISASPQEFDNEMQAIHYLEKMIMTKTSVKLLNFYKGIRISTAAKIVKISNDLVYLSIEKIQGYAMKLEQSVVIQGANMPFDILANVKIVDVGKKIAVLSNFELLQASGNNRQYIRIQSDHRMHVTITAAKSVMSGTILDISIKSIACKLSVSKVPLVLGSKVNLQFNIPLDRFDGGMVTMVIPATMQYINESDEFTKVVVDLELSEPYESYLIEYIYARQQALVNEIKTIANRL